MTENKQSNPFDYVNSILKNKKNLFEENYEESNKVYSPYLTNKALSFYVDTVLYANEMNINNNLDKDQQYSYLINIVRSMNRTHTWFKNDKSDILEAIMKYYYVNRQRAKEISKLLNEKEINIILSQVSGGGLIKK